MRTNKGSIHEQTAILIITIAVAIPTLVFIWNTLDLISDEKFVPVEQAFERLVLTIKLLDENEKTTEVIPLYSGYMIVMYNPPIPTAFSALQNGDKTFNMNNIKNLDCNSKGCICLLKEEDKDIYQNLRCEKLNKEFDSSSTPRAYLAYPKDLKLQTIEIENKNGKIGLYVKTKESEITQRFNQNFNAVKKELEKVENGEAVDLKLQDYFSDTVSLVILEDEFVFIEKTTGTHKEFEFPGYKNTFVLLISPVNNEEDTKFFEPYCPIYRKGCVCVQAFIDINECEGLEIKVKNENMVINPVRTYCPGREYSQIRSDGIINWEHKQFLIIPRTIAENKVLLIVASPANVNAENIGNYFNEEDISITANNEISQTLVNYIRSGNCDNLNFFVEED